MLCSFTFANSMHVYSETSDIVFRTICPRYIWLLGGGGLLSDGVIGENPSLCTGGVFCSQKPMFGYKNIFKIAF